MFISEKRFFLNGISLESIEESESS
jgi:hypothetical protein